MKDKREYAIVNEFGEFITAIPLQGPGLHISLYRKEDAKRAVKGYYSKYKIRKLKVKE